MADEEDKIRKRTRQQPVPEKMDVRLF